MLTGDVFTTGLWATLNMTRESEAVTAPDSELALYRARLLRTYRKFEGLYRGRVEKPGAPWPVDLNVYLDEAVIDGMRLPILRGRYRRLDNDDPDSIGAVDMLVELVYDGCKPELIMTGIPRDGGKGNPGFGRMRYAPMFEVMPNGRRRLTGEMTDHRGLQGPMNLESER